MFKQSPTVISVLGVVVVIPAMFHGMEVWHHPQFRFTPSTYMNYASGMVAAHLEPVMIDW